MEENKKERIFWQEFKEDEVALILTALNTEIVDMKKLKVKSEEHRDYYTKKENDLRRLYEKVLNGKINKKELPGDQTIKATQ